MPTKAQTNFAIQAKVKLLQRGWTVTELAKRVGRSRNAVSIALHHSTMFPLVRERIKEELGL
jgi:DNA-binding Xre family transcriptional regulator